MPKSIDEASIYDRIYSEKAQKYKGETWKMTKAKTIGAVHTHTHTHTHK